MSVSVNTSAAAPRTEVHADKEQLAAAVAERLLGVLAEAVAAHGAAHAVLTGGGAGIAVLEKLAVVVSRGGSEAPDWSRVHLWWGDERLLPEDDPERNSAQAYDALIRGLLADHGLPKENVHLMPTSEDAATPTVGAEMYAASLEVHAEQGGRSDLAVPRFDVVLLGVGPDGHVASLFPGRDSLEVTGVPTVGEDDSPKPPPQRVSLTFDAIHTAERVWLVVAGEDKAEAAAKAFAEDTAVTDVPAKNARGAHETVWHLDRAAAARLG